MDLCNKCSVRRCPMSYAETNRDFELVHRERPPKNMPLGNCRGYRPWPETRFKLLDFLSDESLINVVTAVYNAKKVKK